MLTQGFGLAMEPCARRAHGGANRAARRARGSRAPPGRAGASRSRPFWSAVAAAAAFPAVAAATAMPRGKGRRLWPPSESGSCGCRTPKSVRAADAKSRLLAPQARSPHPRRSRSRETWGATRDLPDAPAALWRRGSSRRKARNPTTAVRPPSAACAASPPDPPPRTASRGTPRHPARRRGGGLLPSTRWRSP